MCFFVCILGTYNKDNSRSVGAPHALVAMFLSPAVYTEAERRDSSAHGNKTQGGDTGSDHPLVIPLDVGQSQRIYT